MINSILLEYNIEKKMLVLPLLVLVFILMWVFSVPAL